MFKPSGADSVWVTVQKLNWTWHGTATLISNSNPNQWIPNGITEPGNPTGFDSTEYPIWTSIVSDGGNCVQ